EGTRRDAAVLARPAHRGRAARAERAHALEPLHRAAGLAGAPPRRARPGGVGGV
ncbi:MAG: hypothetical protein AVDCRST_MAG59-2603, partial [uncultured Thermomicrobiales bacterium]